MFLHWGAVPAGAGVLGGGLDGLSSLKIPAILPKNPFFFLPSWSAAVDSSVWLPFCPPGGTVGGSALSPPKPSIREKNPFTPAGWSHVWFGSVPAIKAAV